VFPLRIAVQAPSLQEQEAQLLIRLTQHALDDLNDFSGHHLRLQLAPTANETSRIEEDVALTIRLRPGSLTSASLHPYTPTLDISYPAGSIPMASSSSSALGTFIAEQLRSTFAEEQAIISYLLSTASTQVEQRSQSLSPEVAEALAKRTTRSMKYAPTYHLTFSLFTSGSIPSSWDIEAAIDEYIRPVLDVLSPIHNFTVDTQVQLYASPSVHSDVLSKEDLSSFINTAEWPLSPSMGGAPTINFLVFVGNQTVNLATPDTDKVDAPTDASSAPTAQSWLIPQWGAVYLVPLAHDATHVPLDHLRKPLLTFTSHLLSLLGAPSAGPLPLRLSTLSRIRSADLLLRASSTLGSLARLSLALPSISIPRSVLEGASGALRHLRLACEGLGGAAGLAHARVAEAAAERAFFEKTMVSQLYFPDEHKIAVYMPLLGPVGVPLLMGALNEARALLAWWRARKVKTL
jgi:phosphatidylinositol glycan class S